MNESQAEKTLSNRVVQKDRRIIERHAPHPVDAFGHYARYQKEHHHQQGSEQLELQAAVI